IFLPVFFNFLHKLAGFYHSRCYNRHSCGKSSFSISAYYYIIHLGGKEMAKTKVISAKEAASLIKDGDTVLIGGFMTNGTAKSICNEVTAKDLTVVCNDGGFENEGTGRLLHNGCIKRLIATHVGLNKEVAAKFNAGELDLKLQPQGTLAEQIRAGGAGLGGFLTPTGIGTIVADSNSPTTLEGKQVIELDGQEYLLEKAIRGNVAIIQGYIADES